MLVDVEGAEESLTGDDVMPALAAAELIVEMHDFIVPGVTGRVSRPRTNACRARDSTDRKGRRVPL